MAAKCQKNFLGPLDQILNPLVNGWKYQYTIAYCNKRLVPANICGFSATPPPPGTNPGANLTFGIFKAKLRSIFYIQSFRLYIKVITSMHSSRMGTTRLLPVSPSMHCAGGGLLPGGVSTSRGGVCSRGVSACVGCLLPGGDLLPGGCMSACTEADTPLWTEWLTDRCKNITFPNFVCGR